MKRVEPPDDIGNVLDGMHGGNPVVFLGYDLVAAPKVVGHRNDKFRVMPTEAA
jgi:hypothetical protein